MLSDGIISGLHTKIIFPQVNKFTVSMLTADGCEVIVPKSQGYCAALSEHQCQTEQAQTPAKQMIDSFADTNDYVIINAAGHLNTLK